MKLALAHWSPEVEAALLSAAGSAADLSAIREDVVSGRGQLWQIVDGANVSYLVTRVERYPNGELELVLVAGAGKNAHGIVSKMLDIAREKEIRRVRAHVERPGLARILERLGFRLTHYVMNWCDYGFIQQQHKKHS